MNNSRKITFEKIHNCRDLGSIATTDGCYIRRGRLLRSANLSEATEKDIIELKEYYQLKKIIDLRTTTEKEQKPDVEIDGVGYVNNPIFDESMIGISHEKSADSQLSSAGGNPADIIPVMGNLYKRMVMEEECRNNLGRAIRLILTHDYSSGSVLWHCTEGKDRCGLVAAFILTILSVDKNIIMEDYLLTNEVNGPKAEMYYNRVLESGQPEEVALSVKDAFLAKEEYLNAAFEVIDEEYGGMENYIRDGLNISDGMIADFRDKMLMTMKYFITEEEREKKVGGSCYFEFQKGDSVDKCWKQDSLLLNMELFDEFGLQGYIQPVIPEFDYYGATYVDREQWQQIFAGANENGGQIQELFNELKSWVNECFEEHERFVIWGI